MLPPPHPPSLPPKNFDHTQRIEVGDPVLPCYILNLTVDIKKILYTLEDIHQQILHTKIHEDLIVPGVLLKFNELPPVM